MAAWPPANPVPLQREKNPPSPPFTKGGVGGFESYFLPNKIRPPTIAFLYHGLFLVSTKERRKRHLCLFILSSMLFLLPKSPPNEYIYISSKSECLAF